MRLLALCGLLAVLAGCSDPMAPAPLGTRVYPGSISVRMGPADTYRALIPIPNSDAATRIVGMRIRGRATLDGFYGAEILTQLPDGTLLLPVDETGEPHAFSANSSGTNEWATVDAPQDPLILRDGARILSVWVKHGSSPTEVEWVDVDIR